jgi:hypothetical protein
MRSREPITTPCNRHDIALESPVRSAPGQKARLCVKSCRSPGNVAASDDRPDIVCRRMYSFAGDRRHPVTRSQRPWLRAGACEENMYTCHRTRVFVCSSLSTPRAAEAGRSMGMVNGEGRETSLNLPAWSRTSSRIPPKIPLAVSPLTRAFVGIGDDDARPARWKKNEHARTWSGTREVSCEGRVGATSGAPAYETVL